MQENNNLSVKDIDPLVELLGENGNYRKLELTTGNCGCFSLALQELTGEGELWEVGNCCHILITFDKGKTFYDGTGHKTREEIENRWNTDEKGFIRMSEVYSSYYQIKEHILNNTRRTTNTNLMKTLILALANHKELDEVITLYDSESEYHKPESR